jgi:hypothetical protein
LSHISVRDFYFGSRSGGDAMRNSRHHADKQASI